MSWSTVKQYLIPIINVLIIIQTHLTIECEPLHFAWQSSNLLKLFEQILDFIPSASPPQLTTMLTKWRWKGWIVSFVDKAFIMLRCDFCWPESCTAFGIFWFIKMRNSSSLWTDALLLRSSSQIPVMVDKTNFGHLVTAAAVAPNKFGKVSRVCEVN